MTRTKNPQLRLGGYAPLLTDSIDHIVSSDDRENDRTLKIDGEVHVLANVGDQGGM